MLLVREVCFFDADRALRLVFDAEVVLVHHSDCQAHGLLLEIYDQAVAVEVAFVILVHLDALVAVSTLVDDAVLFEFVLDLVLVGVAGKIANVNCTVFLDLRLLVGLLYASENSVNVFGGDLHQLPVHSCASCWQGQPVYSWESQR